MTHTTTHSHVRLQFFDASTERYIALVEQGDAHNHLVAFSPKQLVSIDAFNQRLAEVSETARWQGTGKQLDQMIQQQMTAIQTVNCIHL